MGKPQKLTSQNIKKIFRIDYFDFFTNSKGRECVTQNILIRHPTVKDAWTMGVDAIGKIPTSDVIRRINEDIDALPWDKNRRLIYHYK